MKKALIISAWTLVIIGCIINRDMFTIENIVEMSPSSTFFAALMILGLFALKSVSFVFYCGVLYAASGLLFPLSISIPVSIVGTVIMITIPFLIGKSCGIEKADELMEKYPKLKKIHEIRTENDFFFAFMLRFAARLPNDPVSMYMGATGSAFQPYFWGSFLGLLPEAIAITILGTSITDTDSPLFRIAVIVILVITIICFTAFGIYIKRKTKN